MATSTSTVLIFANKVTTSANFDCLQEYKTVDDMTNLSNESQKWVRGSKTRNILIFLKGLVNSYLVAVKNIDQLNHLLFEINYKRLVNLKHYDTLLVA